MYCDIHNGALFRADKAPAGRSSSRSNSAARNMSGGRPRMGLAGARLLPPGAGLWRAAPSSTAASATPAPRHGFVREAEHTLLESGQARAVFALDVPGGDARWPLALRAPAEYRLGAGSLELRYSLRTRALRPCPYSLASTRGFIAPAGSAIRAEKPELPGGAGLLALTPGLFDAGSIDLAGPGSSWFRLERGDGRAVTVDARGLSYVLLWGAPGATPFACIEPWSGYPARAGPPSAGRGNAGARRRLHEGA